MDARFQRNESLQSLLCGSHTMELAVGSRARSPSPPQPVTRRQSCIALPSTPAHSASFSFGHSWSTPVSTPRVNPAEAKQSRFQRVDSFPGSGPSAALHGRLAEWTNLTECFPAQTDRLDRLLCPGDVLVVGGGGALLQIGAIGGYFGHVILATAPARCIEAGSMSARELQSVWPQGVMQLWEVPFVESTRAVGGLHEGNLLLYVEQPSGTIKIAAEISRDGSCYPCESEPVELWQSPLQLRELIRKNSSQALVAETLSEMRKEMAFSNWSELTAVKAALMGSSLDRNAENTKALAMIRDSWNAMPICTSVAIVFWQRLLCKLAPLLNFGAQQSLSDLSLSLIHKWMPVRADRSLPNDMLTALSKSGWEQISKLRHIHL